MRRAWLVSLAFVAACSFDSGGSNIDPDAGDDPDAADGSVPPIDAVDGTTACVPGCTGSTLTTCGATEPILELCTQGCSTSPTPHCRGFSPSNGASTVDLAGVTSSLDVPAGRLFLLDTTDGSIDSYDGANPLLPPIEVRASGDGVVAGLSFRRAAQGAGQPGLAIWGASAVTVNGGASLAQHGTLRFVGPRAAIVIARGGITVRGAIDSGAGRTTANAFCRECGGAGGGTGGTRGSAATGCAPGGNGSYDPDLFETGGAGGGMSTIGADGGDADVAGGVAGSITTCPGATLVPLAGGGGGGRGGYDSSGTPIGGEVGGAGGGAVQLSSLVSITIAGTGDLYAGGLGGAGSDFDYGGGGGGAGGGLLLEAPVVTISDSAKITANGGGGGSGRTANVGDAGNRSTSRASGGPGDGPASGDGRGGRGGVTTDATATGDLQTEGSGGVTIDGTGGGGASAGRVRINTGPTATPAIAGSTVISPAPSIGTRPID